MDSEQAEEIIKAVEQANSGNWLPLTLVTAVFGVVIMLLLYIWNTSQKNNDKRHNENEELIKHLISNQDDMKQILVRLQTNQENQQREIDKMTA